MILECCVDSVRSAIEAKKGGADRLELCANLVIGGTTPTLALYEEIRKRAEIKIHVLIRPRFGDFLYQEEEFAVIRREVVKFREAGADGVVIGCLNENGALDLPKMQELISLAGDMHVTLHRAFDMCEEPVQTLNEAIALGVDTILTSGCQPSCLKGISLLRQLDELAAGRIHIMAGAGVNADAVRILLTETSLKVFHMSGKTIRDSGMVYRNPIVSMGLPGMSEYEIWQTDARELSEVRVLLDEH